MGWSYGIVNGKPVGYSVPDVCNHPECDAPIDRGLSYACGDMPGDGLGCDGFFCAEHLNYTGFESELVVPRQLCDACLKDWQRCDACNDPFYGSWEEARASGWVSGTFGSGDEVATLCPACHAGQGEQVM